MDTLGLHASYVSPSTRTLGYAIYFELKMKLFGNAKAFVIF